MQIWQILERAAHLYPSAIGVVDGPRRFTYAELARRAAALASHLRRGLGAGDRVSILDLNTHAFLETYFATAALGAILNPINHRLSPREVSTILEDAGSRWLLVNTQFSGLVDELQRLGCLDQREVIWIGEGHPGTSYEDVVGTDASDKLEPARVEPGAVAQLYYTSGTTGRPKGVMLTHENVCLHALAAVAELQLTDRDVWGHIAPMFHLADAWATFALTWVGGRHVMVPSFDAVRVLETIDQERVTLSNLIPTMLNLMVKHPGVDGHDLSSLRVVLSGGAPIAPEVVRQVMEVFGCDYIQTYGMTETSPYLTLSTLKSHLRALPSEAQLGYRAKTGRPFLGVELAVVDDDGSPVPADEETVGEIWVRGPTVTPGYWNQPEATREAFTHGWLRTGDLAVLDNEGYVNIVDRKKDMIVCGGENIYSIEVENVLYMHPKVLEAAVYGVSDQTWGERVHAAVVLREGEVATEEELTRFCREHLGGYKVPRGMTFLDALPKTGSGKIQKQTLRERKP